MRKYGNALVVFGFAIVLRLCAGQGDVVGEAITTIGFFSAYEERTEKYQDISILNKEMFDYMTEALKNELYGEWEVVEYLGSAVEYHGVELKNAEEIKAAEEYDASVKEKYLGTVIQLTEENTAYFGAPCEVGYYYEDYSELFMLYRQPYTTEIVPPFNCVSMYLKDTEDNIDIIIDGSNMVVLEVRGNFFKLKKAETNDFFYTKGTSTIEYNGYIYPLSCVEKKQKVYLDVTEIETFETGTLYTLELQQIEAEEEWGDISMGRRYLGYFYVTKDMIYRRAVETYDGFTDEQAQRWIALIESDEQAFIEQCYVVCSEEAVPDVEHENDYHTYIEAVGDLRIFQLYNDYVGGTDDYETIVWQKGKGIVYYEHGAGGMLMHVAFCDDTYYMDAVETYFEANVPELKKYEEYIERDSEGEACLTYYACAVEDEIPGNYGYLVYVGEQWDDYQVNWDWFLVKADLSEIYYYDIVGGDYWTLEEWRTSDRYRNLE